MCQIRDLPPLPAVSGAYHPPRSLWTHLPRNRLPLTCKRSTLMLMLELPSDTRATAEGVDANAAAGFREKFAEFAEFIKSCTAPLVISTKWSFLDDESTPLRIDMPTVEFVGAIQQEYGAEALIELGLYEPRWRRAAAIELARR